MIPPISRVDLPHEAVWHSSSRPDSAVNRMPKAAAKFVAVGHDVGACPAHLIAAPAG